MFLYLFWKLFSSAALLDLRAGGSEDEQEGGDGGARGLEDRPVLLFDSESALRQAGIYFKCQDET